MINEIINVEGMSCEHCKMTVEMAARKIEGVKKAKVNLKQKNLSVKYDESLVNPDQIKEAVRRAGYIIK